jgi:hypothetical protein
MSREAVLSRIKTQWTDERSIESDFVIENSNLEEAKG